MGWLVYSTFNSPKTRDDIRAEIARLSTWTSFNYNVTPLKIANYGSTWYVAVRIAVNRDAESERVHSKAFVYDTDNSFVTCLVFLTNRKRGEWGYKDMEESSGPVESNAPAAILNLLSPLTEHASAHYPRLWRERCRENLREKANPRFRAGDRFATKEILSFNRGELKAQRFEVVMMETGRTRRKRRLYRDLDSGSLVSLSKWSLDGATAL